MTSESAENIDSVGLDLGYADPPYLGCCGRFDHRHEEPWGCWDDIETHRRLIEMLEWNCDGWALSASSPSLAKILAICPADVRVAAWVKPFAAYKANVRIAYTWEPVIFKPGRDSSKLGAPVGRDHLSEPITLKKGLTGAKPVAFCRWVLQLLGGLQGDVVHDIFPGTGTMSAVHAQGRLSI
jgi:hypothetical protein